MKTKITMITAFAVLSTSAIAAPLAAGITQTAQAVATDEQTVTLEVSGLK